MNGLRLRARAALTWVMWSPRRAITTAVVLALVVSTALVVGDWGRRYYAWQQQVQAAAQAPAPTATPTPTPSSSTVAPFVFGGGVIEAEAGEKPTPVQDPAEVQQVRTAARTFMDAWLAGAGTTDVAAWAATVSPLVVPDLAAALPLTEATAIPTAQVEQVVVTSWTATSAVTRADLLDGTRISVLLVRPADQWLVSDYAPLP